MRSPVPVVSAINRAPFSVCRLGRGRIAGRVWFDGDDFRLAPESSGSDGVRPIRLVGMHVAFRNGTADCLSAGAGEARD